MHVSARRKGVRKECGGDSRVMVDRCQPGLRVRDKPTLLEKPTDFNTRWTQCVNNSFITVGLTQVLNYQAV